MLFDEDAQFGGGARLFGSLSANTARYGLETRRANGLHAELKRRQQIGRGGDEAGDAPVVSDFHASNQLRVFWSLKINVVGSLRVFDGRENIKVRLATELIRLDKPRARSVRIHGRHGVTVARKRRAALSA